MTGADVGGSPLFSFPFPLPGRPDLLTVRKIDSAILPFVRSCSRFGMRIDIPGMASLSRKFDANMERIEGEIGKLLPVGFLEKFTGETFNVNSPDEIADLLFDALGLGHGKKLKTTPTGDRISTDRKQLKLLQGEHPVIPLILEYRESKKLKTTYSEALPAQSMLHSKGRACPLCGRRHWEDEWRVHPELTTTRTSTGRMSCKRPPLHQIPVRTELGREIRSQFVAGVGRKLITCDYGQIELRVLAHCASEPSMIEVFKQPDGDIHLATAMEVFDLPREKVDPMNHRLPAKTINFAVCVAEGQRVLTNKGLVPIENVEREHLLWDGEEWVHHDGVIFKGWKKVITYDGVTATPDHKVWTGSGRVLPISEAMAQRFRLAVSGHQGYPIRYIGNYLKRDLSEERETLAEDYMYGVRQGERTRCNGSPMRDHSGVHLPFPYKVSASSRTSTAVDAPFHLYSVSMRTPRFSNVPAIWWTWHKEQVLLDGRIRTIHAHKPSTSHIQGGGYRQDRQRWALRTGKLGIADPPEEYEEHQTECLGDVQEKENRGQGLIRPTEERSPRTASVSAVRLLARLQWGGVAGNPETQALASMEEEERVVPVYDVLNAGPRRRFTVEGKLVSNCYGLSASGLQLGMALSKIYWTLEECDTFIEKWFSKRPGVRAYMDEQYYHARRYGFVWELGGRIRLVPEVRSSVSKVVEAGLRQAGNHRIQGTAATLMKLAIIGMSQPGGLEDVWRDGGVDAAPLMTIHDELIYEAEEEEAETVARGISRVMDGVVELKAPVRSDWKVGTRWVKG